MGDDAGLLAIVMYVLSPGSVKLENLPWKVCCDTIIEGRKVGFVVYRGQSGNPKFFPQKLLNKINPYVIRTDIGRPLSTSTVLNKHIQSFAAPPGRLFMIHVVPGIKYVDIQRELKEAGEKVNDEFFQTIIDNLPATSKYKTGDPGKEIPPVTPSGLRTSFLSRVEKENEIILNLTDAEFRSETGDETWNREEAKKIIKIDISPGVTEDVEVYETGVFPKKEGRGRTFRTKTLRRNKHGRRLTRQSKHRRRNRHA